CDGWRRNLVRARGLRRRGLANRRSGDKSEHPGVRIRARHLGASRGKSEDCSPGWVERSGDQGFAFDGTGEARGMTRPLNLEVLETDVLVAERAATVIAAEARNAVAARGKFVFAVSGGHPTFLMLRALTSMDVPWSAIHVFQAYERVAPLGHPDRNLTHLH